MQPSCANLYTPPGFAQGQLRTAVGRPRRVSARNGRWPAASKMRNGRPAVTGPRDHDGAQRTPCVGLLVGGDRREVHTGIRRCHTSIRVNLDPHRNQECRSLRQGAPSSGLSQVGDPGTGPTNAQGQVTFKSRSLDPRANLLSPPRGPPLSPSRPPRGPRRWPPARHAQGQPRAGDRG